MLSPAAHKRLRKLAARMITGCQIGSGKSGCYKEFFKITESWGVKTGDKRTIIENFVKQRRAWRYGLGPYCFGLAKDKRGRYYYITQIVRVADCVYGNEYSDIIRSTCKRCRHLCRRLWKRLKFNFQDTQGLNMGIDQYGRLICIDFDNVDFSTDCWPIISK